MSELLEQPELKSEEARYLESQQHELVKEKARTLLRIVKRYREDINALRKELDLHRFSKSKILKPESIELALTVMSKRSDHFSEELRKIVGNILIEREIESVVMKGPIGVIGEDVDSNILGQDLSKEAKNENNLKQKHKNNKALGNEGEYICAIIGGNIAHYMMSDNSPKMRLYKDYSGKVSIVFNFIKNDFSAIGEFHSIEDIPEENVEVFLKNAKGFAQFFATNILIADNGFDLSNVGLIVHRDTHSCWSKINYNKSLSYNESINFDQEKSYNIEELERISGFKDSMIKYPESNFTGVEFACELNKSISDIDEKRLRRSIKLSMNNLREVYGNEFLNQSIIEKELKKRLGFASDEILTEQLIEDKIIQNMRILQEEIKQIAEQEFIKSVVKKDLVNKQFFENNAAPESLDLFMKFAILANDLERVKYFDNLNKTLGLNDIIIDGLSPLEYALKSEKNELAIKMMKVGFLLNKTQEAKTEEEIKNIEIALRNMVERNVARPKLRKRGTFEDTSA